MLVLGREINESIMIGDDIEVTLINILNKNKVRIGIKAPRKVDIHRKEIYNAIQKEKEHKV